MASYHKDLHDIGCTNVGSAGAGTDVIGLMLAKREDGVTPAYEEYDAAFLASQFYTGAPSQEYTNPEEELILSQNDFRAGFGQEFYDRKDPRRYFSSIGCDGSNRGQVMLSYGPSDATHGLNLVLNPGLESWSSATDCDNWTESIAGASAIDREATEIRTGTYSAKLTSTGANQASFTQTISWDNSLRSTAFTFTAYVKTSTASHIRIGIYDGVGETFSSYHTGGGAWEQLTVTRTLNASATQFRLEAVAEAGSAASGYVDDTECLATGIISTHADFNDEQYYNVGLFLFNMDASGVHTLIKTMPATITALVPFQVSGTDYLFVFLGTSTDYQYMTTGESFTVSNATNKTYQYGAWVNTTADTMYANDAANTIRSTTNPLNAGVAWSAQTVVGEASKNIQGLLEMSGALYIPKEDMTYYLDSSGNVQKDLDPVRKALESSTSGKNTYTDGQYIYVPCGNQGLLEIDTSTSTPTLTWLNPSNYSTGLSDFAGKVNAVASDEGYVYIVTDNSTKVEVIKGRYETIDGETRWVWHPWQELTMTNCNTAWISSVYKKRLYIASDTATEALQYIDLPTGYGDLTNDANRSFLTGGTFETPWLHGDFMADDKAWVKLTLTMGHTYDADIYWTGKYKKLGDSSWTSIGNYTGTSTSMVHTRYIDTTNKPFNSMMKFQYTGVTDDTNKTPIMLSYDARAVMYPSIRRVIHCVVKCAQDITNKKGVIETNMYSTIKDTLDNARANAVWFVSIRDLDGTTINVKFLPVPRDLKRLLVTRKEKDRVQEREYHLLMLEVPLS